MKVKRTSFCAFLLILTLSLAGCNMLTGPSNGGGSPSSGGEGDGTVETPADPNALSIPVLASQDDSGPSDSDAITNQTSALTLSGGNANPGTTVRLLLADDTTLAEVASDSSGTWTIDVDLAEGSYTIRAAQLDGATPTRISAALGLTIDTTAPAAPALLSPYVGEDTGADLTPRLQWAPESPSDRVDIQADDNDDYSSPEYTWSDLTGTTFEPPANMAVSGTPPVGRRYYFRTRASDAAGNVGAWEARHYADIGRFHADFNGDGYSDLIAGQPGFPLGGGDRGRAFIYFGGASPDFGTLAPGNGADVNISGGSGTNNFGGIVASAGDVNGDGFADLMVVDHGIGEGVFLFHGRASWPPSLSVMDADLTITGSAWSAASAGDVNGDGSDDVLVGDDRASSNNRGAFYLYFGDTPSQPMNADDDLAHVGFSGSGSEIGLPSGHLGTSVAGAGDINGDGYGDWIVGARGIDGDSGRAYVFYGGAALDPGVNPDYPPDVVLNGPAGSAYFGLTADHAGDVNGDGYSDVIVGTVDHGGRLYLGGRSMDASVDVIYDGGLPLIGGRANGRTVAGVGDVNDDGFDDVAVAAIFAPSQSGTYGSTGQVFISLGSTTPSAAVYSRLYGPEADQQRFGVALARIGDLDADGRAEVVVGTANNDRLDGFFGSTLFQGSTFVAGQGEDPMAPNYVATEGSFAKDGGDDFAASVGSMPTRSPVDGSLW